MRPTDTVFALLLASTLALANATILENATTKAAFDSAAGVTLSLLNRHENDALTKRITLSPANHFTITVTDVPQDIWFIVLQIHTFRYNVTLAYDKAALDKVSNRSLFGTNIGLYLKTHNAAEQPIQVFLTHRNVREIDALLAIVPYGGNAPIPGGCNMEFDIEIAPYQKLHAGNEMITVDTQPGSVPVANGTSLSCEKQLLQHRMYRLYLSKQDFSPATYFEAIASMMSPQDIVRNGDEIPSSAHVTSMRHVYSAYTGVGSVYAAIATYGNRSSAYVPTFTYACSPLLYPESCQILNNTFGKVVCSLALILGLFSVFRGHEYVSVDRLLAPLMICSFFAYAMMSATSDLSFTMDLLIALAMLIFGIALAMIVTHFDEFTIIAFMESLPTGLLCACCTYLYAPAEWFYVMENNYSFWLLFVGITTTVAVFLMLWPHVAIAITCSVYGSLFAILAIDYFTEGSLKYIFITLIRRVLVPGFHSAFVYPPYHGADKALMAFWFLLMIMRFITKYRRYKANRVNEGNEINPEIVSLLR